MAVTNGFLITTQDGSRKGWLRIQWPIATNTNEGMGFHEVKLAGPVTPHIPLGISVEQALGILQSLGNPIREQTADEHCHRLDTPLFSLAVYPDDGVVRSVWYNDPTGRESVPGRVGKVEAYLKRYGHLQNWERRLDNGWMHYWFNPIDQVQMVYGVHEDVIRFNQYQDQNA